MRHLVGYRQSVPPQTAWTAGTLTSFKVFDLAATASFANVAYVLHVQGRPAGVAKKSSRFPVDWHEGRVWDYAGSGLFECARIPS